MKRDELQRLSPNARFNSFLTYFRRNQGTCQVIRACWGFQARYGRGGRWSELGFMPESLDRMAQDGLLHRGIDETYWAPPPGSDDPLDHAVPYYEEEVRRYWAGVEAARRERARVAAEARAKDLAAQAARQRAPREKVRREHAAEAARRQGAIEKSRREQENQRIWSSETPLLVFNRFGTSDRVICHLIERGFGQRELVQGGHLGSHRVSRIYRGLVRSRQIEGRGRGRKSARRPGVHR